MGTDKAALQKRFEQIIRTYGDDVYRAALMLTRNRADAEDIVQETFLKYATSAPAFASAEHEKAWLLRVALNLAKDTVKSAWHNRTEALDDHSGLAGAGAPGEESGVYDCVLRLPDKYRLVIHLFYYEGYSAREIGQLLGSNEPAVKTQLHRGRNLLREALKGAEEYAF